MYAILPNHIFYKRCKYDTPVLIFLNINQMQKYDSSTVKATFTCGFRQRHHYLIIPQRKSLQPLSQTKKSDKIIKYRERKTLCSSNHQEKNHQTPAPHIYIFNFQTVIKSNKIPTSIQQINVKQIHFRPRSHSQCQHHPDGKKKTPSNLPKLKLMS